MLVRIRQLLAPPVFEGDEATSHLASLLNTVILITCVCTLAYSIAHILLMPLAQGYVLLVLPFLPLSILGFVLVHTRRVRLASMFFSAGTWLEFVFASVLTGGVRSPSFSGLFLVVLLAGIIIGGRSSFAFAGLSLAAGLAMVLAGELDLLPRMSQPYPDLLSWFSLGGFFVMAAILLYLATYNINDLLRQARRELGVRKRAEQALRRSEERYKAQAEQNAHLYQNTRRNLEELSVLNEIGQAISSTMELDPLLAMIHRQVGRLMDNRNFFIALYDDATDEVCFRLYTGEDASARTGLTRRGGQGLTEHVIHSRQPLLLKDDVSKQREDLGVELHGKPSNSWMGVPLISGERVLGAMVAQNYGQKEKPFDEQDLRVFVSVAAQAAIAVENARLFQETRQRAERLALLNRMARILNTTLDPDEQLEIVYREISAVLNVEAFSLALYDESANVLDYRLRVDKDVREPAIRRPVRPGLTATVISSKRPLLISDFQNDPAAKIASLWGTQKMPASWLGIPILLGDRVIGVFAVQAYRPNAYGIAEQELLMTISDEIAVALVNARLYDDTRRHLEERSVLNEIGQAISSTMELGQLFQVIQTQVGRLMDSRNFYVALYDAAEDAVTFPFFAGEEHASRPLGARKGGKGLTEYIIRTRQPLLLNRDYSPLLEQMGIEAGGKQARSWLGVPLLLKERVVGVIAVQHYAQADVYGEQDLDILSRIAAQAVIAVENARLFAAVQQELEERKRAEQALVYNALHDPLTDLPNRNLFTDRLGRALERAKRRKDYQFAVLYLDLDRFKVVNDSLGHSIGDKLLVESAHRLAGCLRDEDSVARLGGDEFVVLLEDVQEITDATAIADRIQHDLAVPFDLDAHRVFVSVSIGIVVSARYERSEEILRDADIAMYRAKSLGRGRYEVFDLEMRNRAMTRLELETDLRRAFERQEFVVHFQPILSLGTFRIVGFEVLIRWQHPTRGLVLPAEFIPVAEETGLIIPIGQWVLEEACRQTREWQARFPMDPPLTVSVNFSTKQFAQPDLIQKIARVLEETGLDANSLKLELTESLIVEDAETASTMLSQLRALGVQVQIDDFGTGYSSLGYLHRLPIDTLKIDRTFVGRMDANSNGSEIVRTIMALAHDLGMKVIAEGVETDNQLFKLKAMDCEFAQGFLFAKPLEPGVAEEMISRSFARR